MNNRTKIFEVLQLYEDYSKLNMVVENALEVGNWGTNKQTYINSWHTNYQDIRWHSNWVERFEGEEMNALYLNNSYGKRSRWDLWNTVIDWFQEFEIKTCLDIGAANNQFAFLCNKKEIFSVGIEPRESCVNISKDIFEKNFGQFKYGYVGTIKTFGDFFNQQTEMLFECVTVLNFLHGNNHNSDEIKNFFEVLPKITKYAVLTEPKWDDLGLPRMTQKYVPLKQVDTGIGSDHILYHVLSN